MERMVFEIARLQAIVFWRFVFFFSACPADRPAFWTNWIFLIGGEFVDAGVAVSIRGDFLRYV